MNIHGSHGEVSHFKIHTVYKWRHYDVITFFFTWAFRLIGFGRVSRDRLVECWVWLRLFWLVDSGSIQNGWFVIGWVWLAEVRFFEVRIGLNYVIILRRRSQIFVKFVTFNLKKEIASQKIERDLEHARMNFMNFHQSEPDNENQELPQRQFTVNLQFWPIFNEIGLKLDRRIKKLTVVLMVSWLLFLYHWILNADWMLMWNFFRAIYFFDWYWLFCIRAHRLLYVHDFSCCALNMRF